MLHHPQMLRGHVAGDLAGLGKFPHGEFPLQHKLHHPQTHRMGQCPQTFGGLLKVLHVGQLAWTEGFSYINYIVI